MIAERPTPSAFDLHPLEVIPWARRLPSSPWRDLAYTAIFNLLIAVAFTLFGMLFTRPEQWGDLARGNFVFSNVIGFIIHAEFALGNWITGGRPAHWPFGWRAVYFTALPLVGVILGYWIAFELLDWQRARDRMFTASGVAAIASTSILISTLLGTILSARERAARSEAAFAAERARVATAERAAALAQLKALEAQVEPHFLYNTLAHVTSLVDREPATAKRMLDRLILLLRASAAGAADGGSTLGGQLAQVRAYLELVAMRLGPRLAWSIEVPDALLVRPLPPAVLQPLVENAVKHGIEPSLAGGSVAVAAREEAGRLLVEIANTGAGFGAPATPAGRSTGIGLANLRARLAALFGDAARVTIAENLPTGVRVTVSLPAEASHG